MTICLFKQPGGAFEELWCGNLLLISPLQASQPRFANSNLQKFWNESLREATLYQIQNIADQKLIGLMSSEYESDKVLFKYAIMENSNEIVQLLVKGAVKIAEHFFPNRKVEVAASEGVTTIFTPEGLVQGNIEDGIDRSLKYIDDHIVPENWKPDEKEQEAPTPEEMLEFVRATDVEQGREQEQLITENLKKKKWCCSCLIS